MADHRQAEAVNGNETLLHNIAHDFWRGRYGYEFGIVFPLDSIDDPGGVDMPFYQMPPKPS